MHPHVSIPSHICPYRCERFTRNRRCVPPNDVSQTSNLFFVAVRTSKDADREWLRPCTRPDNALVRPSQKTRKGDLPNDEICTFTAYGCRSDRIYGRTNRYSPRPPVAIKTQPPRLTAGKRPPSQRKTSMPARDMNSCKGKGGCGSTKGKNDCKGKGECRTDGKPMEKEGDKK